MSSSFSTTCNHPTRLLSGSPAALPLRGSPFFLPVSEITFLMCSGKGIPEISSVPSHSSDVPNDLLPEGGTDAMLLQEQVAVEVGTAGELVEKYLLFRSALGLHQNTVRHQRYSLRWALLGVWKSPMSEISASMVEDAFLRSRTLSSSGTWTNCCGQQVRGFLRWLLRREAILRDLSACWPVVKEVIQRKRIAIRLEEYQMLRKVCDEWVRVSMDLFWYTGLRRENVLGLKWEWIPADCSCAVIPAEEFKQGREHRQIFPAPLVEILKNIPREGIYVLGCARTPSTLNRRLEYAAIRCGVDPKICYPHNWRATCATRLLAGGVEVVQVVQFMGYANADCIWKHYVRPLETKNLTDAVNAVK